jgi:hypothetical protein
MGGLPFSQSFMYWVGMDVDPSLAPDDVATLSDFYSRVHVPEVVAANPGFVGGSRFELLDPDPRGGEHAGPRWLAVYDLADEAAANTYIERNDHPPEQRPRYTPWPAPGSAGLRPTWRIIWRRISTTGDSQQPPESIFLVGMDIPPDTDAQGLAEFNAFYTNTHVPEVMAHGGYARGIRFERYRAFAHPAPGCPRFCAVYEADEAATRERQERRARRATLTSGPPTWERHDTLWRLVYGRISS